MRLGIDLLIIRRNCDVCEPDNVVFLNTRVMEHTAWSNWRPDGHIRPETTCNEDVNC
jgi:hypothetical protein